MLNTLQGALAYFSVVFVSRFLLGVFRQAWAVPRLGVTGGELLEAPLLLAAMYLAALWAMRRERVPAAPRYRLPLGALALALLLGAEWAVALSIREQSLLQYVESRGPVGGLLYLLLLAVYALLPFWLGRRDRRIN